MDPNSINSISEFLLHAGTEYIVFDMGRRLTPIDNQSFLDIENGIRVAPFPRQQHAWFGIVFWNKNASAQHYIWFVKLPLDEQGLVVTAARNHFLQIIADALGQSIANEEAASHTLPDNPYSFVPTQSLLAQFNALVRAQLQHAESDGVRQALAYINTPKVIDWQTIPMQSIADLATQMRSKSNAADITDTVVQHFSMFAEPFQNALMEMSEAIDLPHQLQQSFVSVLSRDNEINLAALRGLSCSKSNALVHSTLIACFNTSQMNRLDILSVVAARHFQQMDDALLLHFFEAVAEVDDKEHYSGQLFNGFFSDLVQVPQLRNKVLALLRTPERSAVLANAIGTLFSHTKG